MESGYKGLRAYEVSYSLAIQLYEISKRLPREEIYGITSQLRRASLSVPLNIAEGYGRKANPRDYRQFLYVAKGSSNEVQVLLDFIRDLGYVSEEEHDALYSQYDEVQKLLFGIIRNIE